MSRTERVGTWIPAVTRVAPTSTTHTIERDEEKEERFGTNREWIIQVLAKTLIARDERATIAPGESAKWAQEGESAF